MKNELSKSLSEVLATTYILYLKTQNFHWNVEGLNFYALHKMFEKQYEELAEAIDVIAERIRLYKVKAPATMKEFLHLSHLKEASSTTSKDMIDELYSDHQALSSLLSQKIVEAQKFGDEGTADLYIQRVREHDKTAWMLRSHLEGK